ncbi:MAG: restriction endonuclease subunit S [Salinivirgaceae bacterium]|nr:restriction endonuclease subunit S [Salinivirgaceae bacterium]
MAGDWETAPLSELCEQIADCPHSTPLWTNSGVIVLRNQNIRNGRLDLSSPSFTDEAHFEQRSRRAKLKAGDLVLTREAPMGEVCLIPEGLRCCLGQRMVMLRPDQKKCDSRFLLYSIQSDVVQHEIKVNEGTGSTVSNLRIPLLEALPIFYPSLTEQKAIASVLGALDDKIELNRRMNATLEAMAQALFQSWFVDFDPVRAKLDGRQPVGMDEATAALFPSTFQDSALGPIPRGWTADTIKNRASNIQYGFTQSATKEPVGPHFLRITDISSGRIDWASVPFCQATDEDREKYRILDGDIFIARTGASTGDNIYVIEPPSAVFASYLIRIQFSSSGLGRLVGEFTRTPDYASYVAGTIGGSAQPNASAQTLAGASMVFPTEEIADAFYRTVRPLDLMRAANDRESRTLAILRDTLLPKLLSGELNLNH